MAEIISVISGPTVVAGGCYQVLPRRHAKIEGWRKVERDRRSSI